MSENSSCLDASADVNKSGPDLFSCFLCEVKELLSQDDDSLLFSNGSISSNSVGVGLSDYKKESLNALLVGLSDYKKESLIALLCQAVATLTPEVDEMRDSVTKMIRLKSELRSKKLASENVVAEGGAEQIPSKKLKISSSSSTSNTANVSPASSGSCREGSASKCFDSGSVDVALSREGISNVVPDHCAHCSIKYTPERKTGPEGKFLCSYCGISEKTGIESRTNTCIEKGTDEGADDMQFLVETGNSLVEKALKKHSDKLLTTLDHMETKLEELIDLVVSMCRPMKTTEKLQLKQEIKKLPPENLNHVAEIVQRRMPAEMQNSDGVSVELELLDNVTLQRLYYYVESVEKASEAFY